MWNTEMKKITDPLLTAQSLTAVNSIRLYHICRKDIPWPSEQTIKKWLTKNYTRLCPGKLLLCRGRSDKEGESPLLLWRGNMSIQKLWAFERKTFNDGGRSNMRLWCILTLMIELMLREATVAKKTFKLYQTVYLPRFCKNFGWMFHLFSDGDRACQPTGGGGGLRERGGAADVLHPARSARRRCCPHPCSVSIPYSFTFTRAHPWSADIPYSFSFTRADVWTIFISTSLFTVFEIIFCLGIFSASKFQFHCHFQFHWTSSLFSLSLLHWKYSRYIRVRKTMVAW